MEYVVGDSNRICPALDCKKGVLLRNGDANGLWRNSSSGLPIRPVMLHGGSSLAWRCLTCM